MHVDIVCVPVKPATSTSFPCSFKLCLLLFPDHHTSSLVILSEWLIKIQLIDMNYARSINFTTLASTQMSKLLTLG